MGRTWTDATDAPGIAAAVMSGRDGAEWRGRSGYGGDPPVERRRDARRARLRLRRAVGLLLLAAAAAALVIVATSLARGEDAFSGVWWEPDSGRRVEIVREGDGFTLLYGAERRPFAAEKRGDELVIAAPLGGDIVVRAVAADRLELDDGGRTTTLRPAPDGS